MGISTGNRRNQSKTFKTPLWPGADPVLLREHVESLTSGPRDYTQVENLKGTAVYIGDVWKRLGYEVGFQSFQVAGQVYQNIIAEIGPEKADQIVIGAHYDVEGPFPGADDNASGVAGILELARLLKIHESRLKNRIELVAFCLEEPPFFGSSDMGSAVHAKSLKKNGIRIELMMSLEMIGYFDEREGSQQFPLPAMSRIYPSKGNFIAVVGALSSVPMTKKVKKLMEKNSRVDVQWISAPRSLPGVDLSDHISYWEAGYPAVMITDTAFYRNPHYHTAYDRTETLNFEKMAEVVNGVLGVALDF